MPSGENTRLIISTLAGGAVGYGLHVLKARRDRRDRQDAAKETADNARQARKTPVIAFLNVWASEVQDNRKILIPENNTLVGVGGMFDRRKRELIREIASIESDFEGVKLTIFNEWIKTITNMTPGSVESDQGRNKLWESLQALTAVVKDNCRARDRETKASPRR